MKELCRIADKPQGAIHKEAATGRAEFETAMQDTGDLPTQDDYGWEIIAENQ